MRFTGFIFVVFSLTAGCGSTSPSTDITPMLTDMSKSVVGLVGAFDTSSKSLASAGETFAASQGDAAALGRMQAAWRDTRLSWKRLDAFRFGPIDAKDLPAAIDFSPVSAEAIDKAVTAGASTEAAVESLGGNARGFFALEALLFDTPGTTDATPKLVGDAGKARRALVGALCKHISKKAALVNDAWGSGEHFADDIVNAGKGSATFTSQQSVVAALVNSSVFATENLVDTKLGLPLGKRGGTGILVDKEETRRSDNTIAEMAAMIDGLKLSFDGSTGGLGVGSVVREKSLALGQRVDTEISTSKDAVSGMKKPFTMLLTGETSFVENTYQVTKLVRTSLSVDVVSALGITLTFSVNDGD